jgi:hypothetical protein
MKTSLTEILQEALIGKKIKLYKAIDKCTGYEFYLTDIKDKSKTIKIIDETYGFIKKIKTDSVMYEGDFYNFFIVDENGVLLHVHGLYSITSKLEIID